MKEEEEEEEDDVVVVVVNWNVYFILKYFVHEHQGLWSMQSSK
jgi:hypothetical protein